MSVCTGVLGVKAEGQVKEVAAGGEALREGRPGQAWDMQKHQDIRQVKVDLCWGGKMACFKVQQIKASDVRAGKERPPTYQLHLSRTNAYNF